VPLYKYLAGTGKDGVKKMQFDSAGWLTFGKDRGRFESVKCRWATKSLVSLL